MDLALPSPVTFSSLFAGRDASARCWRRALTVSLALHGLVLGMVLQQRLMPATDAASRLDIVLLRPAVPPAEAEEPAAEVPPARVERPARRNQVLRGSDTVPDVVATSPVVEPQPAVTAPAAIATPRPLTPAPAPVASPRTPDAAVLAGFNRALSQAVERQKRYPRIALVRHWQGTAVLKLNIGTDGRLQDYWLARSSGHDALDQQALEMLRDSLPLPELPAQLAGLDLSIDIPVTFRIAD